MLTSVERLFTACLNSNRQAIATARLVGCPGCFPTTSLLALLPLLQGGFILPEGIVIDAKTGTSGGGREARQHLLLAEADEAVAPYGVVGHRHTREIEIQAATLAQHQHLRLQFTPHLLPMVRGLLATVYGTLSSPDCSAAQLTSHFRHTYQDHPCVEVLPVGVYPSTKWVRQTNRALLSVTTNPHTGQVIVMAAADNLLKGQAGQGCNASISCWACRRPWACRWRPFIPEASCLRIAQTGAHQPWPQQWEECGAPGRESWGPGWPGCRGDRQARPPGSGWGQHPPLAPPDGRCSR